MLSGRRRLKKLNFGPTSYEPDDLVPHACPHLEQLEPLRSARSSWPPSCSEVPPTPRRKPSWAHSPRCTTPSSGRPNTLAPTVTASHKSSWPPTSSRAARHRVDTSASTTSFSTSAASFPRLTGSLLSRALPYAAVGLRRARRRLRDWRARNPSVRPVWRSDLVRRAA